MSGGFNLTLVTVAGVAVAAALIICVVVLRVRKRPSTRALRPAQKKQDDTENQPALISSSLHRALGTVFELHSARAIAKASQFAAEIERAIRNTEFFLSKFFVTVIAKKEF